MEAVERADALRRARAGAGISQLEWSRRSGVPQSNISAYEAGRRLPRPETVDRLLAALVERPSIVLGRCRDEVIELAHRNHLGDVRVFGSVQRGTDRAGSDIDLLVTPAEGASAIDLAGRLREECRAVHPEVPWRNIRAVRTFVAHDYAGGDYDVVWNVLAHALPLIARTLLGER